jgi:hypothetical protein
LDKELKASGFLQDDSSSNMELYYQPWQEPKYSCAQSRASIEEKAHVRVHCQLEEKRKKSLANWSSPFAMSRMVSLVVFPYHGRFLLSAPLANSSTCKKIFHWQYFRLSSTRLSLQYMPGFTPMLGGWRQQKTWWKFWKPVVVATMKKLRPIES